MDRNQAIGLILISILVLVYFQFFAPQPTENPPAQEETTEVQTLPEETPQESTPVIQAPEVLDSAQVAQKMGEYGLFSEGIEGEEKEIVLENEDVKFIISSRGGNLIEANLKDYLTWDKKPLIIADNKSHHIQKLVEHNNTTIDLSELYFDTETNTLEDTTQVILSLKSGGNTITQQIYTLPSSGFLLGYELKFNGVSTSEFAQFIWDAQLKRVEEDLKNSRNETRVNFYDSEGDFDNLSDTSTDPESEKIENGVKWFSFKQRFFTSALISDKYLKSTEVSTTVPAETDTSYVKQANARFYVPLEDNKMTFYYGPNNYQIMKKITPGFSENVDLGWPVVNWFNKWLIIPIFNFLEQYISNYGIIIIILSLIIKLLLSPLSYKSYKSMAKTKVLKPELDAIKEKYPDDMQKAQAEQMKLYQEVGVNPLSGCVPLLLQMPILLAMFNFFPNSIELRQESFLWAHDLSTYDSILDLPFTIPFYGDHVSLFTILMTISTVMMTRMNSQMTTVQGPMKTMQYMMPVMFMFFLNNFASGLTCYYFIANLITYVQQVVIRRYIDEDKIRAILQENKRKRAGKKKSAFQQRLEDAMRAREEQKGGTSKKKK